MNRSGDALEQFADYFDNMLADLSPARRKAVARKVGQQLRRSNAARIAANIEPDGSNMEPRKPRGELRGGRDRRGTKMFRKLRYARNFFINPGADGVQLAPKRGAVAIARVHHFGLTGFVGRTRSQDTVRARYEQRRLLGFGEGDIAAIAEVMLAWVDRD